MSLPVRNIPQDVIDRVREALSLPTYFMEYEPQLALRRAGRDFRGRCPFEPGSSDAGKFSVSEDRYYCHACKRTGNIFSWLEHAQDLSFREAVLAAAEIAGIEVRLEAVSPAHAAADAVRAQAQDLLGRFAAWTLERAAALPTPRVIQVGPGEALPVDLLIDSGELGWVPGDSEFAAWLEGTPLAQEHAASLGLERGAALSGRWMLWARDRKGVLAGRALSLGGEPRVVVGMRGRESSGWVTPPAHKAVKLDRVAIASDDTMYVRLRALRLGEVVRPIGRSAFTGRPPRWLSDPQVPPVLLAEPTVDSRRAAALLAKHLLPVNPRVRVVEFVPDAVLMRDPHAWVGRFRRSLDGAGTVLDWQARLFGERGFLETADGRREMARRLAPYVTAVVAPFERAVYTGELVALTGHTLVEAQQLAAAPTPAPPLFGGRQPAGTVSARSRSASS